MPADPRRRIHALHALLAFALLCHLTPHTLIAETGYFGTARININPTLPIRLSGYASRTAEASGVEQNLYATAAAFGSGAETALLIAVDCTGFRDNVTGAVAASLSQSAGIPRERISFTSTHTHSGPCVDGYLTNLFSAPLPPDQQQHVELYTELLTERLEEVALEALDNRAPGHTFTWGKGSVEFGANRRGAGVVDHDLPVVRVADSNGSTKAIIASYASHAVTLSVGDNLVSGDWPGYARDAIEAQYPGARALIMVGAAGDINPTPMGATSYAQNQGQMVADEVARLVNDGLMTPVQPKIGAAQGEISLPFATALEPGDPGSARLAPLGTADHAYGISTWTFGDEIAMVFLEGEVTVDYSLRLKAERNDGRMWVNAYSNEVQGYIPSERILYEGGYEADGSGHYYALPGRFAHGLEDKIVTEVLRQLDPFFNPLDRLRLVIDRASGAAMSIANKWNEEIELDAYTILSAEGLLTGAWNGLADQNLPGWEEALNNSPRRFTEFNPLGSSILSGGTVWQLGSPISLPAPTAFGEEVELGDVELQFEYTSEVTGTVQGVLEFINDPARHNNLVLTIDPATGEAAIQNESPYFDVAISAYTISSSSGRLRTGDGLWNSLEDQGFSGWEQADNANASRLTEFNPTSTSAMDRGGVVFLLGAAVDVAGQPLEPDDFAFEFLLSSGEIMQGVVEFGPLPDAFLPGDYDRSGAVDLNDHNLWRATFGQLLSPGTGADGNRNGAVDAADYVVWRKSVGNVSAIAHRPVPEPPASGLVTGLLVACAAQSAERRSRNHANSK